MALQISGKERVLNLSSLGQQVIHTGKKKNNHLRMDLTVNVKQIKWRRKWQLTPVFLPRKSQEIS